MTKTRYSIETEGEEAWVVIRIPIATLPEKISMRLGELSEARRAQLSPRQNQVLDLILERKQNKEIADALNVSLSTAKMHVTEVLAKMHVTSRAELWFRNE